MQNPVPSASDLPIFQIVIPSYNQGQFIGQTIDSILNQPGVETRIYVMDGGSTDDTVKILKGYGSQITWVSEPDKGQTDAINKGLKRVLAADNDSDRPQFFTYLNSDDFYLPGALATVADHFAGQAHKMWLVGECQIVNEAGQPIQNLIQKYKSFWRMWLSQTVLLVLNPIPQPAVFMRLAAVKQVGEFSQQLKYVMDYEYWLRLWQSCGAPLVVRDTLAAFRIHGQSKGSTNFKQQFSEQLVVARQFSSQPLWLGLQQLHNKVITMCYSFLK